MKKKNSVTRSKKSTPKCDPQVKRAAKSKGLAIVNIQWFGKDQPLVIDDTEIYQNGGRAVVLFDGTTGERFTDLSVWLPEGRQNLPAANGENDAFYVKGWSENEEIVPELVRIGALIPAPEIPSVQTGFVTAEAYRINPELSHWHIMRQKSK